MAALLRLIAAASRTAAAEAARGLGSSAGASRSAGLEAARGLAPSVGASRSAGAARGLAAYAGASMASRGLSRFPRAHRALSPSPWSGRNPGGLQVRTCSSEAAKDQKGPDTKSMFEFVKDLKEELANYKTLSISLAKLEERHKLLSTFFVVSLGGALSAAYTVVTTLAQQDTKVSELSTGKKELENEVKELQKRLTTLEVTLSLVEKYGKLTNPNPTSEPPPETPPKSDSP